MRVKIGNQWFKPEPGKPIAVELTDGDKVNIANMAVHCTRYGQFDDNDANTSTVEQKLAWLAE